MSVRSIQGLQRYLRRLCDEVVPPDDAVLLHRFVAAEDREALALLIARHGPLVLGTARRFVGNTHDTEDVFQAVFLSLARLAKRIRRGRALPAWLHQATCRIDAKVRKDAGPGSQEPSPEPCETITGKELPDPSSKRAWHEVSDRRAQGWCCPLFGPAGSAGEENASSALPTRPPPRRGIGQRRRPVAHPAR